ncbi:GTPase domain-containing protein [Corallococcus macrosporus]|uniref:GTPase domain-containing protein n=1 Tax=Corallococcus macrosporus TaxID=35 RepID=UPI001EE669E4|nr:laccase domain-containing protein [Corallococcus macrosporus]
MRDPYTLRTCLASALDALPAPERFPDASDASDAELARRLAERLRRDLLPRLGSADAPLLLVAIAGPNNVGKSTLFNALVGASLSPARPEGGLTKQCLAAAHEETWTGPLKDFLTRRYDIVPVASGDVAPVDQSGPPGRLYLALSDAVPRGLLVMDTPDFDSVYRDNRERAEALLVTVDVLVFVVSRQTYQNAALVDFLRAAVGHGRPYLLVYNEATREEVARGHLDKLAEDVGHPALARYLAPHQPDVEAGLKPAHVDVLHACTACDPTRFFSHRRDAGRTGRHLNYVVHRF